MATLQDILIQPENYRELTGPVVPQRWGEGNFYDPIRTPQQATSTPVSAPVIQAPADPTPMERFATWRAANPHANPIGVGIRFKQAQREQLALDGRNQSGNFGGSLPGGARLLVDNLMRYGVPAAVGGAFGGALFGPEASAGTVSGGGALEGAAGTAEGVGAGGTTGGAAGGVAAAPATTAAAPAAVTGPVATAGTGGLTVGNAIGGASLAATLTNQGGGDEGQVGSGTMTLDDITRNVAENPENTQTFGGDISNTPPPEGVDPSLWNSIKGLWNDPTTRRMLGTGLSSIFGGFGARNQANRFDALQKRYEGFGAPSRGRYEASYQPGFTMGNEPGFNDAMNQASKANLHALSVSAGNPALSPNAQSANMSDLYSKYAYPALQTYRNQNASTGGYGAFNTAAPGAATAGIGAGAGVYNAVGAGVNDIFNPQTSMNDLLLQVLKNQGKGQQATG